MGACERCGHPSGAGEEGKEMSDKGEALWAVSIMVSVREDGLGRHARISP
jgi:hypothetical protein